MKKNFKAIALSSTVFLAAALWSCKKDGMAEQMFQQEKNQNKVSYTPEDGPPRSGIGMPVVLNSDGNYTTVYGGGISFGTTFTHPLSVPFSSNGLSWTPIIGGGYSPNNMLSFTQDGPHFTMLLGTVVGGMSYNAYEAISKYNEAFTKAIDSARSLPQFSTYATQYNVSSDGILTVNGTFVLDTASPTNVSVTNLNYHFNNPLPMVE